MIYKNTGSYAYNYLGIFKMPHLKFSLFVLVCILFPFSGFALKGDDQPAGDEITVTIEFKGFGSVDIPAIYNDKDVYLSVNSVLDFLKIKNNPSPSFDTVRGFFLNERDTFLIEKPHNQAFYKGKSIDLSKDGLLHTETALYMNLKYFKTIFGIDGIFYFRRLVVTLSTDFELPFIREMRADIMRKNLNRLKGDQKADTTIKNTHPLFHFGMADWAIMSSQQSTGPDQTTLNLGLGAALAGGEANASLNYYSTQPFTEKLQFYQWRYVNNDLSALRQVVAGKIFTQAISSLYAPVVGIQFTNATTTTRSAYGTYRLSNTTEPNWVVELYINDVLVDYTKSDGSGFYSFEVPLMYGYTIVKLRFYGPYGEERTSQQFINIPFNFLPKHEFEYTASGGLVEDDKNSRFSKLKMNYGLTRSISVGGGIEYLSSVATGNTMPFLNTSIRLTQRVLLSGEYTYGVRSRGILSYRLPKGLQVDLDYTNYNKGQTAIYYNYVEERKAVISLPIRAKTLSLFSRLTIDQVVVPQTKYTNAEWSIMGFYKKFGLNFSTYASFVKESVPYLYSIASVTMPIPGKIIFTTQVQFDYKESKPVFAKLTFEKHLKGKGYLDLSIQDFFIVKTYNVLVGIRYDLSFARVAVSALAGNNNMYSRVEAASGSMIVDAKSNFINANNRSNVGRGGIVIKPFLDLNCNGVRDEGEPAAPGLHVRINGGRVFYDEKDTLIRILDLEPYAKYFVELDRNSLESISWKIKNITLNVTACPNNFTLIEVPVVVVGEVSGTLSVKGKTTEKPKGQGQMSVCVYSQDSGLVAKTLTEADGYFSYLGLKPGKYTVSVDSVQLSNLHYRSVPASLNISIMPGRDGDVADGLEFTLVPVIDTLDISKSKELAVTAKQPGVHEIKIPVTKENSDADLHNQVITKEVKNNTTGKEPVSGKNNELPGAKYPDYGGDKGNYGILVEVYDEIGRAGILKTKLIRAFVLPVSIVQDGIDYKVEMFGFETRAMAQKHIPRLREWGFKEALIIQLNKNSADNVSPVKPENKQLNAPKPENIDETTLLKGPTGDITGTVLLKKSPANNLAGRGHIHIYLNDKDGKPVAKTNSESDGYFRFRRVANGNYTLQLDTNQLRRMHLSASQPGLVIKIATEKDLIDSLQFILNPVKIDSNRRGRHNTQTVVIKDEKPAVSGDRQNRKEAEHMPSVKNKEVANDHPVPNENAVTGPEDSYSVLVDAYGDADKAQLLKEKVIKYFGLKAEVFQAGDDYLVEIVGFESRQAAKKHLARLKEWGFPEALVVKQKQH